MSTISDALKKSKSLLLLVELDFDGLVRRYATRTVSVPNPGGDEKLFEAEILNDFEVGTSFDLKSFGYSTTSINLQIANKERLQDRETTRMFDQYTGTIYVWCEGLNWSDIEADGIVFRGRFQKNYHNKYIYSFILREFSEDKFAIIPKTTINTGTYPNHRTEGGGGSVAGLPQPLVFGDWSKGVPLLCVNTVGNGYLVHVGIAKSTEAEYNAATENVYDKDGSVINPANYTFYPDTFDQESNVLAGFDFTGDQAANEPLSCSIRALTDGNGEITGTAATLLEHPAHIIHYLMMHKSDLSLFEIHIESLKTMVSLLPGFKFATIINSPSNGVDIIDRLLSQCLCARIPRKGGVGVMVFDTSVPKIQHMIRDSDMVIRTARISKTPADLVVNDFRVFYKLNPTTGKYEAELVRDRVNNSECEKSYHDYDAMPRKELKLPDVHEEATAIAIVNRYIEYLAYRHDLVELEVPYWLGFDILEGDKGILTLEEGSSSDGLGWTQEPCILLERGFGTKSIYQKWWRIGI